MTRLEELKKRRAMYLRAEEAILTGQEYREGTFYVRRADLIRVQSGIRELDSEIAVLESRGGRRAAFQVMPRDV